MGDTPKQAYQNLVAAFENKQAMVAPGKIVKVKKGSNKKGRSK